MMRIGWLLLMALLVMSPSTGRALFEGAVAGGSQSLCATALAPVGFTVGAPADFFSLDTSSTLLTGRRGDALIDSYVFAGGNECIDGVWRAGAQVVRNGAHVRRDEVAAAYRAALARLTA